MDSGEMYIYMDSGEMYECMDSGEMCVYIHIHASADLDDLHARTPVYTHVLMYAHKRIYNQAYL